MLGSRADAEDAVQDAFLRWRDSKVESVQSHEAWLVTIVTRLCLDRLRSAKRERENYVGPWLPEPIMTDHLASPELRLEFANEVSVAFLAVLERLGPQKRAAFLLREVFDYDYPEIGRMLGKSEAALRQMVHRAREEVREARPRFSVAAEMRERLLERFLCAAASGDRAAVMALLSEDVEYVADGGGKVVAALKVLRGPDRVGRLFFAIARAFPALRHRLVRVNGELGAVCAYGGTSFSVFSFRIAKDGIAGIYVIRNPDKLAGVPVEKLGLSG